MTDDPERGDGTRIDDREGGVTDGAGGEQHGVGPGECDGVACTEAYEQDDVVVLYDAENPLAWVEADTAVRVDRMA